MSTNDADKTTELPSEPAAQEDLQYGGFTRFELELEV
jgi:hypothetical protein